MAGQQDSFQEKTEKATPKHIEEAREQGQVAQSQDLGSAIVLLFAVILLYFITPRIFHSLMDVFKLVYMHIPTIDLNANNVPAYFQMGQFFLIKLLAPFSISVMIIGALAKLMQVGWLFTAKTMEPKFSKLNPANHIKRIFSSRGIVELAKGVFKIIIVGSLAYWTIKAELPKFVPLMDQELGNMALLLGSIAFKLGLRIALAMLLLAILDYSFQRWKHFQDLKMTKQQVKDEFKQSEGDPLVKGRIRQIQMKSSLNRMIKSIPDADVVVTNPTHIAVAIKYDPSYMTAPRVVAKGARKLAERIKAIAREHNIPVIEEKELARALFKTTDVGLEIPYNLFQAVAEVLALIYRLKEQIGKPH